MDTPFNQQNESSQSNTGFSFPVTETVADPISSPAQSGLPVSPVLPGTPASPTYPVSPVLPVGSTGSPLTGSPTDNSVPLTTQSFSQSPPPTGMTITEHKPKSKTKDILLIGLLLILLAGAIFGFTKVRSLLSSAAEDGCAPGEVTEQDLTSNSITVRFTTSEACKMQVAYGVDEVLGLQLSEQVAATDHRIKLTPLMPSTPYRYQIRNDQNKYEPTRGFLTLPAATTKTPTIVVPTRAVSVSPAPSASVPTPASGSVVPTSGASYTIEDFQLHFGSVDPRFDTDKNGVVNIRDWQLYSK